MHADWIDLFALFEMHGVKYLVIGGYAVGFHGFERYTKDIDVWISPTKTNARAIMKSLASFGVSPQGLGERDFTEPDSVVMIGVEPYRIDFLTGPAGGNFGPAWKRRVRHERNGVIIDYIALDDLIVLKSAAGRDVDRRDLEALRIARREVSSVEATVKTTVRSAGRTRKAGPGGRKK